MKKNILVDGVAQTVEMTEAEIAELQVAVSPEVQIEQLKVELARYDYIGVKLAMGVATKEEYAELKKISSGVRGGIGIYYGDRSDGSVVIAKVLGNSPAERAGIKAG